MFVVVTGDAGIPAGAVEGATSLRLGGPKYERFAVEPGTPFTVRREAAGPVPAAFAERLPL